jgi:hypothetical protein
VGEDYIDAGVLIVGKIAGGPVGRLLICWLAVPKASEDAAEQAPHNPAAHRH